MAPYINNQQHQDSAYNQLAYAEVASPSKPGTNSYQINTTPNNQEKDIWVFYDKNRTWADFLKSGGYEKIQLPYDHAEPYGPSAEDPAKHYEPYGENPVGKALVDPSQLTTLAAKLQEHHKTSDPLSPYNPYNPESPLDPYNPNEFFDPDKPGEYWFENIYIVEYNNADNPHDQLVKKLEQLKSSITQDTDPSHHYRILEASTNRITPEFSHSWAVISDQDFSKSYSHSFGISVFQDYYPTPVQDNQDVPTYYNFGK